MTAYAHISTTLMVAEFVVLLTALLLGFRLERIHPVTKLNYLLWISTVSTSNLYYLMHNLQNKGLYLPFSVMDVVDIGIYVLLPAALQNHFSISLKKWTPAGTAGALFGAVNIWLWILWSGKWLGNLPKPAAIMAADDNHAQMVAAAARAQKIEIPGDIRLIGVDNNVLLCTTNRTQISSIATDFVEEGATAAAELKRLLGKSMSAQGRTRKICRTLCLVVKRASTSTLPPGLALVDRARDFIRLNASNPISPTDVAIRMGVSRRLLDLRFREFANSSLLKTITEARLEHVYKCVTTSREPIETVSRLAGFENVNYLKTLFRRRYGLTMREARKASPPLKR